MERGLTLWFRQRRMRRAQTEGGIKSSLLSAKTSSSSRPVPSLPSHNRKMSKEHKARHRRRGHTPYAVDIFLGAAVKRTEIEVATCVVDRGRVRALCVEYTVDHEIREREEQARHAV